MEKIVTFLVDYWQYISIAIVVLLDLIILILKKRSKVEIFDSSAYSRLITLIGEAESLGVSGDEKLKYVLNKYFALTGIKDDDWSRCSVALLVERILSTPTKKGGPGREEVK